MRNGFFWFKTCRKVHSGTLWRILFLFFYLFYNILFVRSYFFRYGIIVRISLLFLLLRLILCKDLAEYVGVAEGDKGKSDQEPEQASVNQCGGVEHGDEHDSHRNTDNQNRMGQVQNTDQQRVLSVFFTLFSNLAT